MREKLSSSQSPAGVIWRLAATASVISPWTPVSTLSFSASRASKWSGARPGLSLWSSASVLPCCFICSALSSSERNGGASPYLPEPFFERLRFSRLPTMALLLSLSLRLPLLSPLLKAIFRHVAAGAVIFVGQEFARHRDLDPVALGIGQALHHHVEIDCRHDAVAIFLLDQRLDRK